MVFFRPMADWLRKPGRSASENGTQDSKDSFNKFQDQTKDAWDCADDEVSVCAATKWQKVNIYIVNKSIWCGSRHIACGGKGCSNAVRRNR